MGGRDSRRRAGPALRQGGRRSRRRRPVDARGLARLARGRPSDSQQGVPARSVLPAGGAPARGAADSRRLPRRRGVRLRRQRGAGTRDGAAVAVGRAAHRAGRRSGRAVLLGQTGLRQLALVAALLVGLAGCGGLGQSTASTDGRTATVDRVTDGDTIRLVGLGRVRLIGVDTPEVYGKQECYGKEASAFVKRLLHPGSEVRYRVGPEPRDRYGRLLAYVWLEDGRFLNQLLAEDGHALPLTIPPNVDYAARFLAAARRARERDRGLWLACNDGQPAR